MGWGGCGGPRYPSVRSRYDTFTPGTSPRATRAADPATPAPELRRLAGHAQAGIRAAVASNPATPAATLRTLALDASPRVALGLAANRRLPATLARRLVRSERPQLRATLAENPGIPRDVLDRLLADDDFAVKGSAVANPQLPGAEVLQHLGWSSGSQTIFAYRGLDNPNVTQDHVVAWLERAGLNGYMIEHQWFDRRLRRLERWSPQLFRAYVVARDADEHSYDVVKARPELTAELATELLPQFAASTSYPILGIEDDYRYAAAEHPHATHQVARALFAHEDQDSLAEWVVRAMLARLADCPACRDLRPGSPAPATACWTPLGLAA